MGSKNKRKNVLRRCTALVIVLGLIATMTGISALFSARTEEIPEVKAAAIAEGPVYTVGEHTLYTDAMEVRSTTVIVKFWHLTTKTDGSITTLPITEEYRFYQTSESVIQLYKKASENDTDETYLPSTNNSNEFVLVGEQSSFEVEQQDPIDEKADAKFSNFSVSSGHSSVVINTDSNGKESLTINYNPDTHLVKIHAFYVTDLAKLRGVDFSKDKFFDDGEGHTVLNPNWNEETGQIEYNGEIDTYYDPATNTTYYNTSSGLHTNKTASVTDGATDDRTFDLNLEAWYSGEDIADVGFILDASGSMAWPTNVIAPLQVDNDIVDKFMADEGYQVGDILTAEQVDQILNKANTDNNRISYSEYNYYVYDDATGDNTVKEFVPLAYWGGNYEGAIDLKEKYKDYDLIGYYPFNGSLVNLATGNTSASLIKHAEENNGIFSASAAPEGTPIDPQWNSNALNIKGTAETGGILLDVVPTSNQYTIALTLQVPRTVSNDADKGDQFDRTPILFFGDLSNSADKNSYFEIIRGNKSAKNAGGSSNRLQVRNGSDTNQINVNSVFNNTSKQTFVFVVDNGTISAYCNRGVTWDMQTGTIETFDFDDPNSNFGIVLGGIGGSNYSDYAQLFDLYVSDVYIIDTVLDDPQTVCNAINAGTYDSNSLGDDLLGHYSLKNTLENDITGNSATYINQAKNGSFDGKLVTTASTEVYTTANGGYRTVEGDLALNLTQTSKVGAVMLNDTPLTDNQYTIMFAMKSTVNNTDAIRKHPELMYIGPTEIDYTTQNYYRAIRTQNTNDATDTEPKKDSRHLRFFDKTDEKDNARIDAVFGSTTANADNGTAWKVITYVVEGTKITAYRNNDCVNAAGAEVTELNYIKDLDQEGVINVILAGLADEYDGADIYIDEMYIFDQALESGVIAGIYGDMQAQRTYPADVGTRTSRVALDDDGNVIATQNDEALFKAPKVERAGWYYMNSHSVWNNDLHAEPATGKQLRAIKPGVTYNMDINVPAAYETNAAFLSIWNDAQEDKKVYTNNGTTQTANKFFIVDSDTAVKLIENTDGSIELVADTDKTGPTYYLVSYACTGSRDFTSFVYYKPDSERIKLESLQYVLGSFTSKLQEDSPRSRVSAVRFGLRANGNTSRLGGGAETPTASATNSSDKTYYSDETGSELDHLVLLDWTKDSSGGIIDSRRGNNDTKYTTIGTDTSSPSVQNENYSDSSIDQYNYFLTGGTYTWTGLKAFYTQLASRDDRRNDDGTVADEQGQKYIILFTDGKDNTVSLKSGANADDGVTADEIQLANYASTYSNLATSPAKLWADKLKAEGYTIYCVMLASGAVTVGSTDYNVAYTYLSNFIAGPDYVNGTDESGTLVDHSSYVFTADSDTALAQRFDEILDQIESHLPEYTVQDYIDPRFDLVEVREEQDPEDATSTIEKSYTIKLGAKGAIQISDDSFTLPEDFDDYTEEEQAAYKATQYKEFIIYDNTTGKPAASNVTALSDRYYYEYTVIDSSAPENMKARLYYDFGTDMYYLQWIDADIPGCAVGAPLLSAWDATIRIRGKDDFIGGNAVLSNGNDEDMNYVFDPTEKDEASSGVDHANPKTDSASYHPSKGFPRTTVDVRLLDFDVYGDEQIIYVGEMIEPIEILKAIGESTRTKINDTPGETMEYWDYLERYAIYVEGKTLDDLLEDLDFSLLTSGKYTIPYYYLPDAEIAKATNSTGMNEHRKDALGTLTFTWEAVASAEEGAASVDGISIKEEYEALNDEAKYYRLTVLYKPFSEDARKEYLVGADAAERDPWFIESTDSTLDGTDVTGTVESTLVVDTDYTMPKAPVGTEQEDEKTEHGLHTTNIVKGEIDMDIFLSADDLNYLQEHYPDAKITYVADLVRDYTDADHNVNISRQPVGTYTFTLDLSKWNGKDVEGCLDTIAEGDFTFDAAFIGANGYEDTLPIGTYTLVPNTNKIQAPSAFKFKNIELLTINATDDYTDHFALLGDILEGKETAADYAAEKDTKFYLGTAVGKNSRGTVDEDYPESRTNDYRDDRLGLARVTGELALGDLEISKTVKDAVDSASATVPQEFEYTLTLLTKANGTPLAGKFEYEYDPANTARTSETTGAIGNGDTFTLLDGEKIIIKDLPDGAWYQITETAKLGYTPSVVTSGTALTTQYTVLGTIKADDAETADYTNTYSAETDLEVLVDKLLTGRDWTDDDSFEFKLEGLDDASNAVIADSLTEGTLTSTTINVTKNAEKAVGEDGDTYQNTFGKLLFKSNGKKETTYQFKVTETKGEKAGITYADPQTITVVVTDNEDGTMSFDVKVNGVATVTTDNTLTLNFENTYLPTPGSAIVKVEKTITGTNIPEDSYEFEFEMNITSSNKEYVSVPDGETTKAWDGPLTTKVTVNSTDAGNAITGVFDTLTFTKAGTYIFTVEEVKGGDAFDYDETVWTVTIVVTDVDSELTAADPVYAIGEEVQADAEAAAFTNPYITPDSYAPAVVKEITGDTPPADQKENFTFTIEAAEGNPEGAVLPEETEISISGAGDASFGEIIFNQAETFRFIIKETAGTEDHGYTYDKAEWILTVVVEKQGSALKVVSHTYAPSDVKDDTLQTENNDQATFVNEYTWKPVPYAPNVEKVIKGEMPGTAGTFTFTIEADSNYGDAIEMPADTITITTKGLAEDNDSTGSFGEISFKKPGTYSFTITEKDAKANGYTYDGAEWKLEVVVTDNHSQLEIESHIYTPSSVTDDALQTENSDQATFVNTYEVKPVAFIPTVIKDVVGEITPAENSEFTFYIRALANNPEDGASLAYTGDWEDAPTVTINGAGTASFDFGKAGIEFTKAGIYKFEITEKQGSAAGYSYDREVWTLTVEVKDNNSQLEVASHSYKNEAGKESENDAAEFKNEYSVAPITYTAHVHKVIAGDKTPEDKDFTFTLESYEDYGDYVKMPEVTEKTITGPVTGSFEAITFTESGTYTFLIKETKGEDNGYIYDSEAAWTLTVVVADEDPDPNAPEQRRLKIASALYTREGDDDNEEEAVFTNEYYATSVIYQPQVKKTVTGDVTGTETFTFNLIASPQYDYTDSIRMPSDMTATVEGSGISGFPDITFLAAGTYVFEISETDDGVKGYTYDPSVWTLTVTIEDNGGALALASVSYEKAGEKPNSQAAEFENIYAPTPVSYIPVVEKAILGDTPEEDETFHFTLTESASDLIKVLTGSLTANVVGEGTAKFSEITFAKAGTYTFEIKEAAGSAEGYTYDQSVWTLTIVVEDVDTKLTITSLTYDKNDTEISRGDSARFENIYVTPEEPEEPEEPTTEPPTEPAPPTDTNNSTQTGDNMNLILWISIMGAALVAAGVTFVIRIKKRRES